MYHLGSAQTVTGHPPHRTHPALLCPRVPALLLPHRGDGQNTVRRGSTLHRAHIALGPPCVPCETFQAPTLHARMHSVAGRHVLVHLKTTVGARAPAAPARRVLCVCTLCHQCAAQTSNTGTPGTGGPHTTTPGCCASCWLSGHMGATLRSGAPITSTRNHGEVAALLPYCRCCDRPHARALSLQQACVCGRVYHQPRQQTCCDMNVFLSAAGGEQARAARRCVEHEIGNDQAMTNVCVMRRRLRLRMACTQQRGRPKSRP
jgi:hypothetical protein